MATPLELRDARSLLLSRVEPVCAHERVPLMAAHGRTLAEDLRCDGPWPATDRSAMDGFCARVGGDGLPAGATLPVVGESLAGRPFDRELQAGEAIRIMTGAVVPAGGDAVVPVEQTSGYEGAQVTFTDAVRAGANIRPQGSERAAGDVALAAGQRVGPPEIGVLAVLGQHEVDVIARPKVAIVATGDEVVPVEQAPLPHQVRESNSWALSAQVAACGGEPLRLGIAPDEAGALRDVLRRGLDEADVLLTIGGISKGTHDLVHGTLTELGVDTVFHGLKLKPGKPTYFGVREHGGRRQYVVGLPGNPASTFTVFDLLVRPLLTKWLGGDPGEWGLRVPLGDTTWKKNWRLQAVPARLVAGADGRLCAELAKPSPSGDPFSLLRGSCYALIPPEQQRDDAVDVEVSGGSVGLELP